MARGGDDSALIASARAGSDLAFGRLVDRHGQAARNFARRLAANPADGDDIAQEAFLHAWTRLGDLREPERFRSWLLAIVWRKAREGRRAEARRGRREEAFASMQPSDTGMAGEAAMAAARALARLTVEQRGAIALCLAGGWTHQEAAEILDLPLGSVKSHIARGRARLSELLQGQDR